MIEVRVRHKDEADAVPFLTCEFGEQYDVIHDIEANGGIYLNGNVEKFLSHQYVMDKGQVYFEIVVGEDE